ncbi:MAG: hypothetical protein MHM6MM_005230 [Cercozoa sp. M6MM]
MLAPAARKRLFTRSRTFSFVMSQDNAEKTQREGTTSPRGRRRDLIRDWWQQRVVEVREFFVTEERRSSESASATLVVEPTASQAEQRQDNGFTGFWERFRSGFDSAGRAMSLVQRLKNDIAKEMVEKGDYADAARVYSALQQAAHWPCPPRLAVALHSDVDLEHNESADMTHSDVERPYFDVPSDIEQRSISFEKASELSRLSKFAAFAYGAQFLSVLGLKGAAFFGEEWTCFTDPNLLSPPLEAKDLLLSQPFSTIERPGHYLLRDETLRAVVLVIRGTSQFEDVVTDVTCEDIPFEGFGLQGDTHLVHAGMAACAEWFDRNVKQDVLGALNQEKRRSGENWRVILTGHSLGAGAAALTAAKWYESEDFADHVVSCAAFGTPALATKDVAVAMEPFVTTVVARNDVVPRLSRGSLHRAAHTLSLLAPTAPRERARHVCKRLRENLDKPPSRDALTGVRFWRTQCAEIMTDVRQRARNAAFTPNVPPGRLVHVGPHPLAQHRTCAIDVTDARYTMKDLLVESPNLMVLPLPLHLVTPKEGWRDHLPYPSYFHLFDDTLEAFGSDSNLDNSRKILVLD